MPALADQGPEDAGFLPHTGIAAIDHIRFAREPVIEPLPHGDTGVLLFRMGNHGPAGTMTTAARGHDEPDLLFLSRGAGVPAHGRIAGRPFALKPNTLTRATFVPAGVDGVINFGVSAHSINLIFPRGYLAGLLPDRRHAGFAPLLFAEDERLARLIRMLEAEIAAPGLASRLLVEGLSRALASLLVRLDLKDHCRDADRIHLSPWKLKRVVDFVEARLDTDIGLADLAAVAELSPFHFSRVFKLATGATPYHYVRDRRLERARRMLSEDRLSIAELALACGFANQSHFTAAFTRAMGVAPGRYRRWFRL